MFVVTASGNLAADPRVKEVDGKKVASFLVLVNSMHKGEKITSPIDCSVWGTRAKVVEDFYKKGSQVTVTGAARLETYTNKEGLPVSKVVLSVNDFNLPARPSDAPRYSNSDDDL